MFGFKCDIRACALRWFSYKVVQWRWPIIVGCLFVAFVSGYGLTFLAMTPESATKIQTGYLDMGIHLTGLTMTNVAYAETDARASATLIPLMLAIIIALLGLTLRSAFSAIATLLVVIMSVATVFGLAGWSGLMLNLTSTISVLLILGLTIVNCVHLLTTVNHQLQLGQPKYQAITSAVIFGIKPIFFTSLALGIGFLSFNFSDVPPFRDLGNIVAAGMIFGFLYVILFFPATIAVLPIRRRREVALKR